MLQTKRLLLREWKDEDVDSFARMNDDPRVARYLGQFADRAAIEAWRNVQRDHFRTYGYGIWALEDLDTGGGIGFCGLMNVPYQTHFTPAVEIAWRLHAEYWGRGYATEAASAALSFGFERVGLSEVVAYAFVENLASRRVMERLGMSHDPQDDFDLPGGVEALRRVQGVEALRRQVLYRLKVGDWVKTALAIRD
ncbi:MULTISPECIES: GNAT family N-acetyltransferase [unclassified Mesorhizobium]|uniref:GNAT family N-acetyltransferase n=1 Tax=unclassified Mesorhizobium TaxID=325217 RepID=UPI00333A7C5D